MRLREAGAYALFLLQSKRIQEVKSLLRKTIPVMRRVIGEFHHLTLATRANYAVALYNDPDATLDDLREAVTTLEEIGRIARRVFGGAYPLVVELEDQVQEARAALRARETLGTV